MRKVLIIATMLLAAALAYGEDIGYVETTQSWYYVYDSVGKRITSFSRTRGELQGYSSEFIILKSGSWYYFYDAKGNRINSMSANTVGEILSVTGDTFTSRSGSWIYTWSKNGRRLASRAAHTVK